MCKKCSDLVERRDEESGILWMILAIIGAIVVTAGIAYAVYRFLAPDYYADYDDDLDDEFEDDDPDIDV